MKKTTLSIAIIILATLFTACDTRSVGENNNQPENLTRRQIFIDLVSMVMSVDETIPCESTVTDVKDDPELCRAITLLNRRGKYLVDSYADGLLHPEQTVNHAEMWKLTNEILGFVSFSDEFCAPDIVDDQAWYSASFSTFCAKGLFQADSDGNANPSYTTTLEEWNAQKERLQSYFEQTADRFNFVEQLHLFILQDGYIPLYGCTSDYEDVEDDSVECYLSNLMIDEGLLDPDQANFRGADTSSWDEVVKIALTAGGVEPLSECTSCMASPEHWGCYWMDKLCEIELDFGYIVSNEVMNRYALTHFNWHLSMYINSTL